MQVWGSAWVRTCPSIPEWLTLQNVALYAVIADPAGLGVRTCSSRPELLTLLLTLQVWGSAWVRTCPSIPVWLTLQNVALYAVIADPAGLGVRTCSSRPELLTLLLTLQVWGSAWVRTCPSIPVWLTLQNVALYAVIADPAGLGVRTCSSRPELLTLLLTLQVWGSAWVRTCPSIPEWLTLQNVALYAVIADPAGLGVRTCSSRPELLTLLLTLQVWGSAWVRTCPSIPVWLTLQNVALYAVIADPAGLGVRTCSSRPELLTLLLTLQVWGSAWVRTCPSIPEWLTLQNVALYAVIADPAGLGVRTCSSRPELLTLLLTLQVWGSAWVRTCPSIPEWLTLQNVALYAV